jgi:hypothetical protein
MKLSNLCVPGEHINNSLRILTQELVDRLVNDQRLMRMMGWVRNDHCRQFGIMCGPLRELLTEAKDLAHNVGDEIKDRASTSRKTSRSGDHQGQGSQDGGKSINDLHDKQERCSR